MHFKDQAQHFLDKEKQFHLGILPTEKSHPLTSDLSDRIIRDTSDGVRTLMEVDRDIVPIAREAFLSHEYDLLVKSISACIESGNTVCFSSCGASGRLAIILESMWRSFWSEYCAKHHEGPKHFKHFEDQVYSIMTGGDRALIRSVENFEDYQEFGRRQFRDSGLGKGDLLIALTEGGEISSVIGTMKEALENGSGVFMVYNNPTEVLIDRFDRSREMLTHPGLIKLNLTTGPMALAGSTRLQATTIAMLVVGAALEESFERILPASQDSSSGEKDGPGSSKTGSLYTEIFEDLISQLNEQEVTEKIAELIDIEADCYLKSGRVTYVADRYLLDIFSDTTERSPTFMIPPFRQFDDTDSPVPWAYAMDPLRNSYDAWIHLLKREPRGLDWTKEDYLAMGAPPEIQERVHSLDNEQILKFHIGKEGDPSRYLAPRSVLMRIIANEPGNPEADRWWEENSALFTHSVIVFIGQKPSGSAGGEQIHIPLEIPESRTRLFTHLAIKMIFNILSTGTMAKIGRIRGNWMIQLDATNKKLTDRAIRIIAHFAEIPYENACHELFRTISEPAADRKQFKESYIIQTLKRLGVEI